MASHPTLTIAIIFFLLALAPVRIVAQDCPENIFAGTQQNLDNLMAQYPNCENLAGSVSIGGTVSDLTSLSNLRTIGGSLSISSNDVLTSLQGLNGVASVGGQVFISQADALVSCAGLDVLTSIGGQLRIQDCDELQSLDGLQAVVDVGDDLTITNNPKMTSIDGLENLTTVEGNFQLYNCHSLAAVNGVNRLVSVAEYFGVYGNELMAQIGGFNALTTATLGFAVDCETPCTVPGFTNLQTTGGVSLRGEVVSLDLPALERVEGPCNINVYSLTSMTGFSNLSEVTGNLVIGTGMRNLPDFESLESVGGMLVIDSRDSLRLLDGFNNLTSIGSGQFSWGFDIYDHDKLTHVTGFNKLTDIAGTFAIDMCDALISVEGITGLQSIGHNFIVRNNTKLTDCRPFCEILENEENIGGAISIFNNGPSTEAACSSLEKIRLNCAFTYTLLDGNLILDLDDYDSEDPNDIRELTIEEVMELDDERLAVAADGVSPVVVKMQFMDPGSVEFPQVPPDEQYFETPWGTETMEIEGENILYVLFTPPEVYNIEETAYKLNEEVDAYDMSQEFEYTPDEEFPRSGNQSIPLSMSVPIVKPPVVLVHGTLSKPTDDFLTSVAPYSSMKDTLTSKGYKVFIVDYTESNGTYYLTADNSSFEQNKMVVWGGTYDSNTGGIKDALTYYRDELKVAVTQVDVVGNDMGGLLARIYASDGDGGYNPLYRRAQNFMEGDINRLVTIATPHLGSHFREFQVFLENNTWSLPEFSVMDWLSQVALVFYYWYNNYPITQAVRDQQPPDKSPALVKIGATDVPSHAIMCRVPFGRGQLQDVKYDESEEYYDLFWYTTLLLYNNEDVRKKYIDDYKLALIEQGLLSDKSISGRDASKIVEGYDNIMYFKTMVEDGIWYAGQVLSVLDGTWAPPAAATVFKYVFAEVGMSDYTDPLLDIVIEGNISGVLAKWYNNIVGFPSAEDVITSYLSTNDKSMEIVRSFIFNNDYNDGIVSVKSQSGRLEEACATCVTDIEDKVLHRFAPRYPKVQEAVWTVLDDGMERFSEDGMPAPGEPVMLYYPDSIFDIFAVTKKGAAAICQSGMVPAHAQAFAKVANEQDVVIMVRPVNPDATPLIECDAATKIMNVKPKSSNWGPQRGYLPTNQRYSKMWKVFEEPERSEKIEQYNEKVQENLNDMITVEKNLQVSICQRWYNVFVDLNEYTGPGDDEDAESEIVLIPFNDPNTVCQWDHNSEALAEGMCRPVLPEDDLTPFTVMATPGDPELQIEPRYLTADYDLLMIGFFDGPDQGPPDPPDGIPFDPDQGQITPRQKDLLQSLNQAVIATGYEGGGVSHHGPENQFNKSPYIDYPITVFAPDKVTNGLQGESTGGKIFSVDMGPKGFRDMHLKRLVNELRDQGYNLYDNPAAPGWHWTWNEGANGYNLEDSDQLSAYVEQLPRNFCDKTGRQIRTCECGTPPVQPDVHREKPTSWLGQFAGDDGGETSISVYPNPAEFGFVTIDISMDNIEFAEYTVTDAIGNIAYKNTLLLNGGMVTEQIDVNELWPGVYTITVLPGGMSARFVRL